MPVSGSDGSHFETEWDYLVSQLPALSPQAKDMPSREETDWQQYNKKIQEFDSAMPPDMRGPPVPGQYKDVVSEENQLHEQPNKDQNDPYTWGMGGAMNRTAPAMVPYPARPGENVQAGPSNKDSNTHLSPEEWGDFWNKQGSRPLIQGKANTVPLEQSIDNAPMGILVDRNNPQIHTLDKEKYDTLEAPDEGYAKQFLFIRPKTRDPVVGDSDVPAHAIPTQANISNLEQANVELGLSPQERELYNLHLKNLNGPGGVDNPDGSRSTLFAQTVEADGRHYIIPTVKDGKILDPKEATDLAFKEGIDKYPSYETAAQATERYDQLHGFMEKDTKKFQTEQGKQKEEVQGAYDKVVKFLESLPNDMKGAENWTWRERLGDAIMKGMSALGAGGGVRPQAPGYKPNTGQGPRQTSMEGKSGIDSDFGVVAPTGERLPNTPSNANYDFKKMDQTITGQIIRDNVNPELGLTISEIKGLMNKYTEKFGAARDPKMSGAMSTDKYVEINNELKKEMYDIQRAKMSPYDKEAEAQASRKGLKAVEGGKEPTDPKVDQMAKDIKKIFGGTDASPEFRQIPWGFTGKQMSALTADEYHYFRNSFLSNNKFYRQWLDAYHDGVHNNNRIFFDPKSKTLSAKEKVIMRKIMEIDD